MNFIEKVKSMKPSEIVQAMIDGLRARHAQIRMSSFGQIIDGVCYGCAATNAILHIDSTTINYYKYISGEEYEVFDNEIAEFIEQFEAIINDLRCNRVFGANLTCYELLGFRLPDDYGKSLPYLGDNFTKEELLKYQEYADYCKTFEN